MHGLAVFGLLATKHEASDKQTGNGTELQRRLPGLLPVP